MSSAVCIVDTNVLVAGLISSEVDSPVVQIVDTMFAGGLIYLLSPALLDEYRDVLLRPKLKTFHGLSDAEVDDLLTELVANALWREPDASDAAPDPGDDHLWALLAAYPGSILVTGDQLLMERPPSRVSVVSPKTFAKRLRKSP